MGSFTRCSMTVPSILFIFYRLVVHLDYSFLYFRGPPEKRGTPTDS